MPVQYWEALLNAAAPWTTTDGAALANSTAETIISPSSPDFTFPANFVYPGMVVRVSAAGRYSTTGTPTLTLQLRWGGVAGVSLLTTGAATTISAASNTHWRMEADFLCRSQGPSGTVMPLGKVFGLTSATAFALLPATAPATATVDTTTAKSLVLTGTWGTASASNTITCHEFLIEALD